MTTQENEKFELIKCLEEILQIAENKRKKTQPQQSAVSMQAWFQVSVMAADAILEVSRNLQVPLTPKLRKFVYDCLWTNHRNSKAKITFAKGLRDPVQPKVIQRNQAEAWRQSWCLLTIESCVAISKVLPLMEDP